MNKDAELLMRMRQAGRAWDASAKILRHRYPANHEKEVMAAAALHRSVGFLYPKGSEERDRHEKEAAKLTAKLSGPHSASEAYAAVYGKAKG